MEFSFKSTPHEGIRSGVTVSAQVLRYSLRLGCAAIDCAAMHAPKKKAAKRRRLVRNPTIDYDRAPAVIANAKLLPVDPEWFHDGSLLAELSDQHMSVFAELDAAQRSHGLMKGRWTWGDLCSGSGGAHFVMQEASRSMNDRLRRELGDLYKPEDEFYLDQLFACESEEQKRIWLDNLINHDRRRRGQTLICIFCDIRHMGRRTATCHAHGGRECIVPGARVISVSTSCKDLSNLSHAVFPVPVLSLETSPGGSADTFRGGLLVYLDSHPDDVSLIFYENSDNMADDGLCPGAADKPPTNLDVFNSEMALRQFESQPLLLNAKLFAVPQTRRRFFAVLLKVADTTVIDYSRRSLDDMLRTLRCLLEACQRKPPQAIDLFLPDLYLYRTQLPDITKI